MSESEVIDRLRSVFGSLKTMLEPFGFRVEMVADANIVDFYFSFDHNGEKLGKARRIEIEQSQASSESYFQQLPMNLASDVTRGAMSYFLGKHGR